jgi:hypothetical protein
MGVLDILPSCVSSVYFVYDKTWGKYSLGKVRKDLVSSKVIEGLQLSASREAALASECDVATCESFLTLFACQERYTKPAWSA